MALDRLGNTVATGQVYLLAGVVRAIDGDRVTVVVGEGDAMQAVRVAAGEVVKVDDATTGGGGGGAPTDAEYLVGATHASLSAERLVTNTSTITWDLATAGQAKANLAALDAREKQVVVVEGPEGDAIAIHAVGNLSLTWDHRAFDGAYCAAFLKRVKEIIETRDWAAELA